MNAPKMASKPHLLSYLCCPACRGTLDVGSDVAACQGCSRRYPIVDDVLLLLRDEPDEHARRLRWRYEATTGGTSLPSVFRTTRNMLGDLRGRAVLDVGCSTGDFALTQVLPGGASLVIGVDFAASAIQVAQARAEHVPNALFVVGDAQALPVRDALFDRVVITEVVEHLPDSDACLAELRRVVKHDGEIVLSTPNYFNAVGIFKPLFDRFHHGGRERWTYADHSEELERFQTPFSVRRQVTAAGFDVVEFRGTELWMGIRKALMIPWLLFDHGLRRLTARMGRGLLSRTPLKYFGVVQFYRLRK